MLVRWRNVIQLLLIGAVLMAGQSLAWAGRNGMRWDKTPDAFQFLDLGDVPVSTLVQSGAIIVSGINTAISVTISGGEYSVNGGTFTSASDKVVNGDSIVVRQTSSALPATTTHAVLDLNGVSDSFDVTTQAAVDTVPDAFVFIDQTDAPLGTVIESNSITVSGINSFAPVTISGGEYSVNGGEFTAEPGNVGNGDNIVVRQTSSSLPATTTHVVLDLNSVSDSFDVTTQAVTVDTVPDAFTFIDQTDAPLGTVIESNAITVSGIDSAAPVTVSGGEYSINGGAYISADGSVVNGDSISVRLASSLEYQATTQVTLTIGGVADTFNVTTLADTSLNFQLPPQSPGNAGFTSEHFAGSGNCTMCHNNLSDGQGNDVSIEKDWSATMMANSARDPFWKAKVRSELNRNPQLADVISDKCTRCHAPMANFEAKSRGESIAVLDNGFLDPGHARHDEAMNGVSCTLCHQIQDAPTLGTLDSFTGHYEIGANKEIYGPYDNLFPNPMIMNTGYTPMYSIHTKESELCATCHNLKTPYVDEAGNVLSTTPESEFPEQMPYSEWLHSDYAGAQSCQQCHMARSNGVAISNRPMWLGARDDFAVHEFVGANKLMLNMLNDNKEQLGVTSANFADILAATETMLQGAASIERVDSSLSDGQLNFTLRINSHTGHKLPSAYPSRRVIVHVVVTDAQNNVVFESGKVNANGSVEGVDADFVETAFEPHYDLITSPEQVQVYEAIMGDNNDDVTYTLLRGMSYLKDNRLLPNGFDKGTAPDDVAVAGSAYEDADFVGGGDQVQYRIGGLPAGSYRVSVELVYQTLAYGFARDLFKDAASAEVNDFKKMYGESINKSTVLTALQFDVL